MELRGLQLRLALRIGVASALAIGGMVQSVLAIRDEIQRAAGQGVGPVIAELEQRDGTVRRKRNLSFVWYRAAQAEKLYLRDTLRTGAESSALIRFTSGASLELEENTTVRLDGVKELELQVTDGQATFTSEQGTFALTGDGRGGTRIQEIPIRLLSPKPLAVLRVEAGKTRAIPLRWQSPKTVSGPFTVQVSRRRAFPADQTVTLSPEGERKDVAHEAGVGNYYWRVRAAGEKPAQSATGRFSVRAAEALEPELPKPGARKVLARADTRVEFRWKAPAGTQAEEKEEHWLELAADEKFATDAKGLIKKPVRAGAGAESLGELKPGALFWRIRSRYGDVEVASAARPLEILSAKQAEIRLLTPPPGAVLEPAKPIALTWESGIAGLRAYVEVRQRESDESVASGTATARGNLGSWTWSAPSTGRYLWRVTADIDEEIVSETAWRPIRIRPGAADAEIDPIDLAKISEEKPKLREKAARSIASSFRPRVSQASPSPTDEPSPDAPTSLTADLVSDANGDTIELFWGWESEESPAGFAIEASDAEGVDFRVVAQAGPNDRKARFWPESFPVPTERTARFRFRVRPDFTGQERSSYSPIATLDVYPAPRQMRVQPYLGGGKEARISWQYSGETPITGFQVFFTGDNTGRDQRFLVTGPGTLFADVNPLDSRLVGIENVRLYVRAVPDTKTAVRGAPMTSEAVSLKGPLSYPLSILEKQPTHYFRLNDQVIWMGGRPLPFRDLGTGNDVIPSVGIGHRPTSHSLPQDESSGSVEFPIIQSGFQAWLSTTVAPIPNPGADWSTMIWINPQNTNPLDQIQSIFSAGVIPPPPVFPPNTIFVGLRAPWLGLIGGQLFFSPYNITGAVPGCPPGAIRIGSVVPGAWSFVAITKSSSGVRAYLNGQPAGTVCAGTPQAPDAPSFIPHVNLGAGPTEEGGGRSIYYGQLSEWATFNRELTAREINALYEAREAPCVNSPTHGISCQPVTEPTGSTGP